MEFWGLEVNAGAPQKVTVDEGTVIHLSQASFGEIKKGKAGESVPLFVEIDGKKLVIGHLSAENSPCQSFDLVFEKDFSLSHNSKNGSVYFTGYSSELPDEEVDHFCDSDSEEDEPQLIPAENGKPEAKVEIAKPAESKPQPKKDAKPMEVDESDDESDDDDSDDEDDSEDSEESEEEEETPKKVEVKAEVRKKRAAESQSPKSTPVAAKKAKGGASPSGGKKGGTPHPAKQTGKSPAAQKSGGKHSHNKGKHGGK